MSANIFGEMFRVTTFGESHGECVGCVIDGCPAGLKLSERDVQVELDRRRPGQSSVTSPRGEKDQVRIRSGVFEGKTTGMPIMMMVENKDVRSADYKNLKDVFRPGHADFTYAAKYGIRDYRGGGRSSARETVARVMAGAVARKYLKENCGMEFVGYVEQLGEIFADVSVSDVKRGQVEKSEVRCPDKEASKEMISYIKNLQKEGDSCGGVVGCVIRNVPVGLGEPVFDKLHAALGHAVLSINACKGFEIGSGFAGAMMNGSEHNDEFEVVKGDMRIVSNNAGGVLGGISSGSDIYFSAAFKPVATIGKKQKTVSAAGRSVSLQAKGRHDPCVVPRAVPIVEAMAAMTMMDFWLRGRV